MATAVSASISTPVRSRVSTVTSIETAPASKPNSTCTRVSVSGCASGIRSAVRFAAWMAAMRATPSTSPLFADPSRIIASVAAAITMRPPARAIRLRDFLAAHVDHVRLPGRVEVGKMTLGFAIAWSATLLATSGSDRLRELRHLR